MAFLRKQGSVISIGGGKARRTRIIGVVPDGVATIDFAFAKGRSIETYPPGVRAPERTYATVYRETVKVVSNVYALRVPPPGRRALPPRGLASRRRLGHQRRQAAEGLTCVAHGSAPPLRGRRPVPAVAAICVRAERHPGWTMAQTLEELIFEQARDALALQERTVSELRQRAGTLLAAGALAGSLLATTGTGASNASGWTLAAAGCVAATLLALLAILLPHRLVFVLDVEQLYEPLREDRDDMAQVHLRMADVVWRARRRNFARVEWLHRCFAGAVVLLGVGVLFGGVGVAVN